MARIEVANTDLRVQLSIAEKVMAFHGAVTVSLLHVDHAEPYVGDFPAVGDVTRFSGTYLPGHYAVGTEAVDSDHEVFYDVHHPEKAVLIELSGGHYKRLVVEVDDASPESISAFINEHARKAQADAAKSHRIHDELERT